MSFKVAETYSDVTQAYLKASIDFQYRGKGYKISDDLTTILESDFKRKAHNLDWLFQGKTRIHLTPTAERVFKAVQQDKQALDLIAFANAFGYGVDADNFVGGYLIIDKQQVKLNKAKGIIFSDANLPNASKLPKDLFDRFTTKVLRTGSNKYKPEGVQTNESKNLLGVGELFVNTDGFKVQVHPLTAVKLSWNNTSAIDTDHIIESMNSTEVIMSIDINDFITCSEGSVSSCMSMNSSYHLGWMLHYRSDFSVMTFTHKKGDTFNKTGRSWTFIKLTEDGLPFQRPFYKLSKIYGALNASHINMADDYIQEKALANLGLKDAVKHTDARYGDFKHIVSPNIRNTHSGTTGTGYFDWHIDSLTPFWTYKGEYALLPFDSVTYSKGPVCVLNFPDALDLTGEPTNEGHFNNAPNHDYRGFFGWNERVKQFVICKASGKRIMLRDSLLLPDGSYIHKDIAASIIMGKPAVKIEETPEKVYEPAPTIELSDEDVADF